MSLRWLPAHLLLLCVCNVCLSAGMTGLVGLMPVYLARLGADAAETGRFLAFLYVCLAVSTVAAGKLSHHVGPRKMWLALGGTVAAPLTWALGKAPSIERAMLIMGCLWFATGVALTITSILTGLSSEGGQRGRRFGALTFSSAMGLLLGGLISGQVVDRWGFPALFTVFGWAYLIVPLAALLVDDQPVTTESAMDGSRVPRVLNGPVVLVLVASVLAQAANITLFLSRTLIMDGRGFGAIAISMASAAGSLLTLPLPFLLGWLADRLARKPLILACFVAPVLGLMIQLSAVELWQFWLASALSTVLGSSIVVTSALVSDLVPTRSLSMSLALLNATSWVGIVIGLTAGGAAIYTFDMALALRLAAVPGVAAMLLLMSMRSPKTTCGRG